MAKMADELTPEEVEMFAAVAAARDKALRIKDLADKVLSNMPDYSSAQYRKVSKIRDHAMEIIRDTNTTIRDYQG